MRYYLIKIGLIILSVLFLIGFMLWLMACLFAVGQLHNTYNLFIYFKESPIAVLILVFLLGASIASLVAAVRLKK